jgi:adenylosuccinate lyase
VPEPYEKLKAFTRGNKVTQASMQEFVGGIEGIPEGAKAELLALTPATYIGNAAQQAKNIRRRLAEL